MDVFLQAAIDEARKGLAAGGIPIGSVLVLDGQIIGRGHNQRVQHGSVIHHAEMNCLENAGRLPASRLSALHSVFHAFAVPDVQRRGAALQNSAHRYRREPDVSRARKTTSAPRASKWRSCRIPSASSSCAISSPPRPELWNEDIGV